MLLQDVRDNKTEAASAAPQALRLCQMVGFTAQHVDSQMHHGSKTTISSHSHAIVLMLTPKAADKCIYITFQIGGLFQSYVAQLSMMSVSTVKVVSKVAEQPVIARSKFGLGGHVVLYATLNQAHAQNCTVYMLGYRAIRAFDLLLWPISAALLAFLAPILPTCRTSFSYACCLQELCKSEIQT